MPYSTKQRRRSAASPRSRKIARLWCLARELEMDEPMLRVVVASITGSESISGLTWNQLIQVARALEQEKKRRQRHGSYERGKQAKTGIIYMPTNEQKELVQSLLDNLNGLIELKNADAYLDAICQRIFKKQYVKLNRQEIGKVIEALKSIMGRTKKSTRIREVE
jgi:hypothetical protein